MHDKARRAHLHPGVLFGLLTEAEPVLQSCGSACEVLRVKGLYPNLVQATIVKSLPRCLWMVL